LPIGKPSGRRDVGHHGTTRRREAVDTDTGEVLQLELLPDDALDALKRKAAPRYDWHPYPGRHVNVAKALMAKVWHKDSGYTQNERDLFGFFLAHTPEGGEPLRLTYKEISEALGLSQTVVGKGVQRLHTGGLLLEREQIGRIRFYGVNPRAAFDGSAVDQVEATKDARFPVLPAPATRKAPATRRVGKAS
jgi:hypothetical protein